MSSDFSFGSSKSCDTSLFEVLDEVSPFVNTSNSDEVDLFSQIHLSSETSESQQKLISLLLMILRNRGNSNKSPEESKIDNFLLSLLNECLALLQALTSGDSQTNFSNLNISKTQAEIFRKQAQKVEDYLSSLSVNLKESQPESTKLETFLKQAENLPLKINEIQEIKSHEEKETNPKILHFYFNAIFSLLETTLIMNDFLLNENKELKSKRNDKIVSKSEINTIQNIKIESSRERELISQLEDLLGEKDKLITNINTLEFELNHQNQIQEIISKLKTKMKNIEEENFQMRKSLDEMVKQNVSIYNQVSDNCNLSDQIATQKKENSFLREQYENLQEKIKNYQDITTKKNFKIEHLTNEVKALKEQNLDISSNQDKLQNIIKELQVLYQESTSQAESYKKSKDECTNLLNKARKEINSLIIENDELKVMLQRASREAQKQIIDNATLLKQLRRQNALNENPNENENLKEKLQMAQFFIKKLQEEISKYRDQIKAGLGSIINDNNSYISEKKPKKKKLKEKSSFSNDDSFGSISFDDENERFNSNDLDLNFDPKLSDFDKLIDQLEQTVIQTRNDSINHYSTE